MPKYHKSRNPINTTPFFNRRSKMPSQRRIKVYGLLIFVAIISILFWTTRGSQSQDVDASGDFYSKTVNALDGKGAAQQKVQSDKAAAKEKAEDAKLAKEMTQRLKEAAQVAKEKANAKAPKPDPPSSVVGVGSSADGTREKNVAGRKKYTTGEAQEVVKEEEVVETPERRAAVTELNKILKKGPIIIFSKSYCPHSARAKRILLDQYLIDPKPYVVELDQHEIGADLQSLLAERTGRKTVPNVLINGVSIGGGDDVAELDEKKTLIAKINELGAKKIFEAKERPQEAKPAATEEHEGHEEHKGHGLR